MISIPCGTSKKGPYKLHSMIYCKLPICDNTRSAFKMAHCDNIAHDTPGASIPLEGFEGSMHFYL